MWQTQSGAPNTGGPHTGSRYAYLRKTGSPFEDDWLFTRRISLVGGQTYHVAYWYRQAIPSINFTEQLSVYAGTAANAGAMSILVDSAFVFTDASTPAQRQATFTPSTTGTYHFGWHCTSAPDQGGVNLDDIEIYSAGECIAPELTVPATAAVRFRRPGSGRYRRRRRTAPIPVVHRSFL